MSAARFMRPLAPVAAGATVLLCDSLLSSGKSPLIVTAALDEPAHLATSALALAALLPRRAAPRGTVAIALAASVLIDIDHVPLYLGLNAVAPFGRPVTHSLFTPLVLIAIGGLCGRRARARIAAVALGVCLHLLRDLATGPGVSLCWPLDPRAVLVPYPWYVGMLVALTGAASVGVVRRGTARRRDRTC